jgi:hypothetical protein
LRRASPFFPFLAASSLSTSKIGKQIYSLLLTSDLQLIN